MITKLCISATRISHTQIYECMDIINFKYMAKQIKVHILFGLKEIIDHFAVMFMQTANKYMVNIRYYQTQ